MNANEASRAAEKPDGVMRCEDIQGLLVEYMSRELGGARSELVREHLRRCPDCRAAAADIQSTMEALQSAAGAETGLPEHLSAESRSRLTRAVLHPVLDWMYRHHIVVSFVVALIVLVAALIALRKIPPGREIPEPGPEVIIGTGAPPTTVQAPVEP